MTRKRLRYSELAVPPAPAAPPVETPPSAPPVAEEMLAVVSDEPIELVARSVAAPAEVLSAPAEAAPPPPRPRRNSTPIELARTLAAERADAIARGEIAPPSPPKRAPEPYRSLRERARRREGEVEMLMFRVSGERFAVELVRVDEVMDLPVIHHVPEMPPAMLGVVAVRGSLTPVYSPGAVLGLPLALREAVLIFRHSTHRVGILIDDVDEACSMDLSELRETAGGDEPDSVLLGVVRVESSLVGIIDADALIVSCQSAEILEIA